MGTGARTGKAALTPSMYVGIVAYVVLIAKVLLLSWIDGGIWVGGAGIQRFAELAVMDTYGLFAPGVEMLSSGYASLVHLLGLVLKTDALWPVAVMQSALLSFAVWYFAVSLRHTRIAWATVPLAYLLLLDPPFSMATLALGPDGVVGSLVLLGMGQLVRDLATPRADRRARRMLLGAASFGVAALLAPLLSIGAIIVLYTWAAIRGSREQAISLGSAAAALLLALPLLLLVRNEIASNSAAIPAFSTDPSISVTGGAGNAGSDGSRCGIGSLGVTSLHPDTFRCLVGWYREASAETSDRAVPNATAFWAPWIGPMSKSGLDDNPWTAVHPLHRFGDAADPRTLLGSPIASFASWLWLLASMALVVTGAAALRGLNDLERELSTAAIALVGGTWVLATLTDADAGSRMPVLGLTVLLQLIGLRYLATRGRPSARDPFVVT